MLRKLIKLSGPIRYWYDSKAFRFSEHDKELKKIKDQYKGQPMLVVGNGPSLNDTPLSEFKHIPSIGMNKINMLFDKTSWRPSLIVCVNDLVVKQGWREWLELDIPVHLGWKARHFVPRIKRDKFNFFLSNPGLMFEKDISTFVGSAGTVTYTALQYAHYLGADPVIIVGVDHSFQLSEGSKPNEYEKRKGTDVNHFDPNYFAPGTYWGVPNLESSEYGYSLAKKAFEEEGRNVYDATIGGKLNIFDKISIGQAIELIKMHN